MNEPDGLLEASEWQIKSSHVAGTRVGPCNVSSVTDPKEGLVVVEPAEYGPESHPSVRQALIGTLPFLAYERWMLLCTIGLSLLARSDSLSSRFERGYSWYRVEQMQDITELVCYCAQISSTTVDQVEVSHASYIKRVHLNAVSEPMVLHGNGCCTTLNRVDTRVCLLLYTARQHKILPRRYERRVDWTVVELWMDHIEVRCWNKLQLLALH
jgi:hypothetical protein